MRPCPRLEGFVELARHGAYCGRLLPCSALCLRGSIRLYFVVISKTDRKFIIVVVVVIGLRLLSSATADLAYMVTAVYALSGRAQAIQALVMSWLLTNISPGLAPSASMAGLLRFAILICAAMSIFLHGGWSLHRRRARTFFYTTIWLGLFIIFHSLVFSPYPDVSILKALSWSLAMATIIVAWQGLSEHARKKVSLQIFGGLIVILVVSLPLSLHPLGYLRNGSGFQGILNNPQVFGPVMALLGTWAVAQMLSQKKPGWWLVTLTGACIVMIMMSEARTAGLSLILGIGTSLLLSPFFANVSLTRMAPGLRSPRIWSIGGIALLVGIVAAPLIGQQLHHYLTKSGRAEVGGLLEAYEDSRGVLMAPMIRNISEHPMTGIGFGVESISGTMIVRRDPVFGIPLAASIEKGVTPLAVLEELGIPGAIFVAAWLVMLLKGGARSGLAPFAVCLTVLFLNLGEATLFSPGGAGLLYLVLLGWAFAGGSVVSKRDD